MAFIFLLFASSVSADDKNIVLTDLEIWNCHEPSKTWDWLSRYGGEGSSQKRNFEVILNGLDFIALMTVTDGTRSATHLYSDGKFFKESSTNGVFFPNDAETSKRWSFIFKPSYPERARLMDRDNVYECWKIDNVDPLFKTLFNLNPTWFMENN